MHLGMLFLFFCLLFFFSATMGLSGWPMPPGGELTGGVPQPPSLAYLRVLLPEKGMGKLEELMNTMCLLELDITPELVQGRLLRVLVECWLASRGRFLPQLKFLFPASVMNENLRRAVISSGIAANVPTAAVAFFDKAGAAVAEAFEAANIDITATGAGGIKAVAAHQTALSTQLAALTGAIGIWCCACRDCPFSSASKPIDLGLGFQVHWVHIRLGFPASALVGTLNG
jgi:hypothetical protein